MALFYTIEWKISGAEKILKRAGGYSYEPKDCGRRIVGREKGLASAASDQSEY
jgi:hypothetical protein